MTDPIFIAAILAGAVLFLLFAGLRVLRLGRDAQDDPESIGFERAAARQSLWSLYIDLSISGCDDGGVCGDGGGD